jgi:hypothetical protein
MSGGHTANDDVISCTRALRKFKSGAVAWRVGVRTRLRYGIVVYESEYYYMEKLEAREKS